MIKLSIPYLQTVFTLLSLAAVLLASNKINLVLSLFLCLPQVFRRFLANYTAQARNIRILAGPPVAIIGMLMPNNDLLELYGLKLLLLAIGLLNIPQKSPDFHPIRRKIHGFAMKTVALIIVI
jgi:hypothetical protein